MDNIENIISEVYRAINAALESKLHLIGSVLTGEAKGEIIDQDIRDKEDFYRNTEYRVNQFKNGMNLGIGSNVAHEPYVLGGKVPSWTPFAPIKAWVERKGLNWVDKKSGKQLTIDEIAWLIIRKIKRDGIKPRNVFAQVIENREQWIYEQFNNIEIAL